jgi:DNA-binding IclR family transcriptional regulator
MRVKQAANVLDILEFFARERRAASLAELSTHFGWPRSSTFNLISTLVERGFLYEPKPRGGFYPTPRWLALAEEIAEAEPLPEPARALLRDLAAETGETVWIAAHSGQHAVLMSVIQSAQAVRYTAEPGRRVPLHGTASGQAIMSQMSAAQVAGILRRAVFERFGPGTPMSVEEVEESIRSSLERGGEVVRIPGFHRRSHLVEGRQQGEFRPDAEQAACFRRRRHHGRRIRCAAGDRFFDENVEARGKRLECVAGMVARPARDDREFRTSLDGERRRDAVHDRNRSKPGRVSPFAAFRVVPACDNGDAFGASPGGR